jgi:hypothetical protein
MGQQCRRCQPPPLIAAHHRRRQRNRNNATWTTQHQSDVSCTGAFPARVETTDGTRSVILRTVAAQRLLIIVITMLTYASLRLRPRLQLRLVNEEPEVDLVAPQLVNKNHKSDYLTNAHETLPVCSCVDHLTCCPHGLM